MDNVRILTALAVSLGLTLIFETGFYLVASKTGRKNRDSSGTHKDNFLKVQWNRKDIFLVILVNTLTNPPVVLLYWLAFYYTNRNTTVIKIPLELFAVLTEGFIYKRYAQSIKKPFLFSLAANTFSFALGIIVQIFI